MSLRNNVELKEIVSHLDNFVDFRLATLKEAHFNDLRTPKFRHSRKKQPQPHLSAQSEWTTRCTSGSAVALSHEHGGLA